MIRSFTYDTVFLCLLLQVLFIEVTKCELFIINYFEHREVFNVDE